MAYVVDENVKLISTVFPITNPCAMATFDRGDLSDQTPREDSEEVGLHLSMSNAASGSRDMDEDTWCC